MPVANLGFNERMVLQNGALVKVAITNEDSTGSFVVSLANPGGGGTNFQSLNAVPRNGAAGNMNPSNHRFKQQLPVVVGIEKPLGPDLNKLKAGDAIPGTVTSLTSYGAFLSTNVYRQKGKSGRWVPVDVLLHRKDIPRNMLTPSPLGFAILYRPGDNVTVYVKEVFKNSG
jgi:hypothetical protein